MGYEPHLFDLALAPDLVYKLDGDPAYRQARDELPAELLKVVDPEAVGRQARANLATIGLTRADCCTFEPNAVTAGPAAKMACRVCPCARMP